MAGQAQQAHANGSNWTAWPKWAQFIFVIGPTAAIALYLVFRVDGRLFSVVERVEARIEAHAMKTELSDAEQVAAAAALVKAAEADRAQMRTAISILRTMCVHMAGNRTEENECMR